MNKGYVSEHNKKEGKLPLKAQVPRQNQSMSSKNARQKVALPGQNMNKPPLLPMPGNVKKVESKQNSR